MYYGIIFCNVMALPGGAELALAEGEAAGPKDLYGPFSGRAPVSSRSFDTRNFGSRASDPRTIAYIHVKMPLHRGETQPSSASVTRL